ncbi:unnamed protein product [marine sediment metagenome]|uniref:Uncharacterized protein n=1 Tax=marine sediment metagenome TaxID=412755 RepID=X1PCY3_9ZZZZ
MSVGNEGVQEHTVINRPKEFLTLQLNMLTYLKRETSLYYLYKINLSKNAAGQIGKTGKKVLEEILLLHNDFITPRRT